MDSEISMLPSCWGSLTWFVIHSIAYVYNPQKDRESYYIFFNNLGSILPCEECRLHYKEHLNIQELNEALNSNEALFKWVYDLHNKVNKQLNVPESEWPSYESVKEKYNSFKTSSCSEIPGVCGSTSENSQKKIKIVEQFGPINNEQWPFLLSTIFFGILFMCACIYIIKNKSNVVNRAVKKVNRI